MKIKGIDGLKGIGACVIAFCWHYQHFAPQNGTPFYSLFSFFYTYGLFMVEIFFMLSGFGMVLGYERKILDNKITIRQYLLNKIKKLYPTMILTLFITTLLQIIYISKIGETFVYPNFDLYHFLLNIFGLQNGLIETAWSFNSPSWCISVILVCYCLLYLLVKKMKSNKDNLFFGYLVLALLGVVLLITKLNYPIFNSLIARGVACFFIGAFLAKLYQSRANFNYKRVGITCMIFLFLWVLFVLKYGYAICGDMQLFIILGAGPLLLCGILFCKWVNAFFSFPVFVYLGKISLSIYLWHFPIQCLIRCIDVYFNLNINYSSRKIWIIYVVSVLLITSVYEKLIKGRFTKFMCNLFINRPTASADISK